MTKFDVSVYDGYCRDHMKQFYKENDMRTWPFYPIIMPLNKDGYGPEDEDKAVKITFEVWDRFCNSYANYDFLADAINLALIMNEELFENDSFD